jgi:hypothetical protein
MNYPVEKKWLEPNQRGQDLTAIVFGKGTRISEKRGVLDENFE